MGLSYHYIQDLMLEELGDGLEHYQSLGSDLSFCVMRHVRNILLCIIEDFVLGGLGYIW